jgi:hypothetical protein
MPAIVTLFGLVFQALRAVNLDAFHGVLSVGGIMG